MDIVDFPTSPSHFPVLTLFSNPSLYINYHRRAKLGTSVLTKRICMQKKEFLMNIFKYCLKNSIKLHEFANSNSANYDV